LPNPGITLGVVPLAPAPQASACGANTSFHPGRTDGELNAHRPTAPEDINTLPVETVQKIIKETLQQMGVGQVEVSQSPRLRQRQRRSTNTQQLVKEQQSRMSPKTDIEWKVGISHTQKSH
jgi:hypothetical protein